MGSFADQVGAWAAETEERLERVWQTAVADLATEMARTRNNGGTLPHKTGNLMNSLLGSTAKMPNVDPDPEAKFAGMDAGAFAALLKLGDEAYLGYQAVYARRMNFGFVGQDSAGRTYNQTGFGFVERAAAMWPQIVREAAEKVRAGR